MKRNVLTSLILVVGVAGVSLRGGGMAFSDGWGDGETHRHAHVHSHDGHVHVHGHDHAGRARDVHGAAGRNGGHGVNCSHDEEETDGGVGIGGECGVPVACHDHCPMQYSVLLMWGVGGKVAKEKLGFKKLMLVGMLAFGEGGGREVVRRIEDRGGGGVGLSELGRLRTVVLLT